MKKFIKNLGQRALEESRLLSNKTPMVKEKILELGRVTNEKVSSVQDTLGKHSVQAIEKAKEILDSPQVQNFSSSISSRVDNLKSTIDEKLSSGLLAEKISKSTENVSESETKIKNAIESLRSRDKIGLSAEVASVAGGAAAGAAAAGTIAGAAGATTLFGSTGLATLFGGVFVTTTPVGWVIGSAVIAGAAGYGLVKLVRSGAKQDHERKELIERLTSRLSNLQNQKGHNEAQLTELKQLVALTLALGLITQDQGNRLVELVQKGSLEVELAIKRLRSLALESGAIETTES